MIKRNKEKSLKYYIAMILCFVLSFNIVIPAIGGGIAYATNEKTNIQEINSFEDFFIFAQASQGYDYDGKII